MKAKLITLTPMLRVADLLATMDFYVNTLGFSCEALEPDWGWACAKKDSVEIMFALPNTHQKFDGAVFTGSLYLRTNNVDSIWQELKDKVSICYPMEDFDYGMREFAVYDNNGYLLQYGQEI